MIAIFPSLRVTLSTAYGAIVSINVNLHVHVLYCCFKIRQETVLKTQCAFLTAPLSNEAELRCVSMECGALSVIMIGTT